MGGGLVFVAIFMSVNFLPALDTVREFGVMPVTFVSSSKIPIAQSFDLIEPIRTAWSQYSLIWWTNSGMFFTEPMTGWFSSLLVIPKV